MKFHNHVVDDSPDETRKLSRVQNRRQFLRLSTGVLATGLAGCAGGDDEQSNTTPTDTSSSTPTPTDTQTQTQTDTPRETERPTEATLDYDVTVEYSTHVQNGATGEYDLPEPAYDNWGWLVVDLEVTSGELSMQEVWFRGFIETEERLYAVAHDSSEVENGVESRGSIREGGRGVILHNYPPSPRSDVVGYNTSVMRQSVGGTDVVTSEPTELYPPVSVEYSVSTTTDPDRLPSEYANRRGDGETWAIVSLDVTEGFLNMEDVWFRSRLTTESRQHELSHASQHATRGTWSRGMVKAGNSMHALYLIGENKTVQEWGYTEDGRQNTNISRI